MNKYQLKCDCGSVTLEMAGEPRVRGTCHCGDCRTLLQVPFHVLNAWLPEQLMVVEGEDNLTTYQHPTLSMERVYCNNCGETLYNTNAADWKIVSQFLVSKNFGSVPDELRSISHFYYDRRIIDIDDNLPKK